MTSSCTVISIINRDVELMCSSILKTIHKKRFVS
uniref:Uncharacterized protein n=1 Tax=Anguilla anguilla TaxID=7936 RepID=A0A0E9TKQ3_ANGAN